MIKCTKSFNTTWAHLNSLFHFQQRFFGFGFSITWIATGLLIYQIEYKAYNLFWNFCPHWWCKIRTSLLTTVSKHDHIYQMENKIIFAGSSISGTSNKGVFLGPNGFTSTFISNTNNTRQGEPNFKKNTVTSRTSFTVQFSLLSA